MDKIEEVLEIKELEKLKKVDLVKALRSVQHLVKGNKRENKEETVNSELLPYEAVSVVGPKQVTIKFELDPNKEISTNKAIIIEETVDSRDNVRVNKMARYFMMNKLEKLARSQKEKK